MQTAGARVLPEDDERGLSREAVLLQWERKIEQAERRSGRFQREDDGPEPVERRREEPPRRPDRTDATRASATRPRPRETESAASGRPGRRTITITGQPVPARRRRSVVESQLAQPDRIALWAFLLGLFLVAVAAGTAHA
jgi:hypothetical protein